MIFDEESILQERSEMEDKAQGGALNSSIDTQEKRVESSENPKRPDRSNEIFADSYGDEHKVTQEQLRTLR